MTHYQGVARPQLVPAIRSLAQPDPCNFGLHQKTYDGDSIRLSWGSRESGSNSEGAQRAARAA